MVTFADCKPQLHVRDAREDPLDMPRHPEKVAVGSELVKSKQQNTPAQRTEQPDSSSRFFGTPFPCINMARET